MSRLRVGVVGVGYLGYFHAQKYAQMEGVELVGVADLDQARAEKTARDFKTKAYKSHLDLLGKIEAASVAVPTGEHYRVAADLLAQKVHCLVEKPIAASLAEADALIGLAEQAGVILQVGHIERFNPAVAAARQFLSRPIFIEARRLTPFQARGTDVDVILDLMIHDIDLVLSLAGEEPQVAKAVGAAIISARPDVASARLEFPSGCAANLTSSRISTQPCRQIQIFQASSHLLLDCAGRTLSVFSRQGPGKEVMPGVFAVRQSFDHADPLACELAAFVRSVQDKTQPLVSGQAGRLALQVALSLSAQLSPEP